MPRLNTTGPTQPNKNYQPVAGGQDNKAGNSKKVAGKSSPNRFFLTTLATKIRDTMICNRSISVVDSITPKIILPTQGLENAPEKDASANRLSMRATPQEHEEETELRPWPDETGTDTDSGLSSDDDTDELTQELTGDLTGRSETNDSGYFSEPTKKDTIDRGVADETAQNPQSYDMNFLRKANMKKNPVRETVELLEDLEDPIMVNYHVSRPWPDETGTDTVSGLSSDDDTDELTQELTGDLTGRSETNDSGYFSEPTKKDTIDRGVADEIAQNPQLYNMNFLRMANMEKNPVRETVELLEDLEDPIMVNYYVSDFLNNCRTRQQWLDNPHDLTMAVLKKLQTIINDSSVSMHEKAMLDKKLAITAQQVLQHQLPQLNKEQAWERLDTYERLLSGNTYNKKMRLYKKAFDNLSSHFGLQDPWHFQMRRLDKGLAGPGAFAHLVKTQDNHQKVLMLNTLLDQKTRLLNQLDEVIKRYDTLDGDGYDDHPFAGNEQMAEMIKLSKTENTIRRRLGTWDQQALNKARSMLKNL